MPPAQILGFEGDDSQIQYGGGILRLFGSSNNARRDEARTGGFDVLDVELADVAQATPGRYECAGEGACNACNPVEKCGSVPVPTIGGPGLQIALADAGLVLDGDRITVEIDQQAFQPILVLPPTADGAVATVLAARLPEDHALRHFHVYRVTSAGTGAFASLEGKLLAVPVTLPATPGAPPPP